MDKTKLGVVGVAATALAAATGAPAPAADTSAVPTAHSYADLLEPIPNAVERLQRVDQADAQRARLIKADYYRRVVVWERVRTRRHWRRHYYPYRRYYYPRSYPAIGFYYGAPLWYHHHHHHHHHFYF